jgi:polyisoprenyl-phosphate glycosyltransferase
MPNRETRPEVLPGLDSNHPAGPLLSIVTPAHNEEAALEIVIENLVAVLRAYDHEIIIIDDGSNDNTWEVIKTLRASFPQIRAIRFTRNFGHQAAILSGLFAARGDAVIMMDSDGQHPVGMIPEFIERWQEGYLVVQGVRARNADESIFKKWTSKSFYRVLTRLSGIDLPQGSADFRLIARPGLETVLQSTGPLLFLRGLIPWFGYDTCYVEFAAKRRVAGQPSYTWRRMIRLSIDGLMGFSIIPLRLSIFIGVSLAMLAFVYLTYILVVWMTARRVVPGWASMAGLLSLLGGVQLFTIGVLGEYLGRLFLSNLNRPHFVVSEQI